MLLRNKFTDIIDRARKNNYLDEHGIFRDFWFCYDKKYDHYYLADCDAGLYVELVKEAYDFLIQLVVDKHPTTAVVYLGDGLTLNIRSSREPAFGAIKANISISHKEYGILSKREISIERHK